MITILNPLSYCVNIKFYYALSTLQIYERFDVDSIADADDARFDYFVKKVCFELDDLVVQMHHVNGTYDSTSFLRTQKLPSSFRHLYLS